MEKFKGIKETKIVISDNQIFPFYRILEIKSFYLLKTIC